MDLVEKRALGRMKCPNDWLVEGCRCRAMEEAIVNTCLDEDPERVVGRKRGIQRNDMLFIRRLLRIPE